MSKLPVPPELIETIVDHAFNDKMRDDGAWDETGSLPKEFLRLATVSKAFVYPVRRALYESLRIEGGERFLLLVGQLRFCPQLAHFVRTAHMTSTCHQLTYIDGSGYGSREPTRFLLSDLPVVWFLDACPNLRQLVVTGPDFIPALASLPVARCKGVRRIKSVEFIHCDHQECDALLPARWLAPILAYPALEELELCQYRLGHKKDPLKGPLRGQSTCKMLTLVNLTTRLTTQSVVSLVAAMPRLEHFHLEAAPLPSGGLHASLFPATNTLKELVLIDHYGEVNGPDAWEVDVVASLPNLEVLAILQIPVRPTLFKHLPPKLRHLKLSCLDLLPAPLIVAWLKGRFDIPRLRLLETSGPLKRAVGLGVDGNGRATPEQMDEIRSLCAARGIKWDHDEGWAGDDLDDSDLSDIGGPGFAGPFF
ncbi:hypothetical protein AURDEDRAFT_165448 [Auricularia subglabra TFB-10046 SS5]|nr:hypothetical protein AURDEDRAFT_165448 [Auricularia subglabra TFB-10046 SS5]